MAFITDRTLFIHIQKTGGMSVRQVLYQCKPTGRETGEAEAERHFGLPELRATHPGIEAGRISFGFVRHPVSWLRSRWAFAVMTGFMTHTRHGRAAASNWMGACWADDFPSFVEKSLDRFPGIATQTMYRMLGVWSDKEADRIGRNKSLFADLISILGDAGEVINPKALAALQRKNETAKAILEGVSLSPVLQARVMASERALCDRFSYDGTI